MIKGPFHNSGLLEALGARRVEEGSWTISLDLLPKPLILLSAAEVIRYDGKCMNLAAAWTAGSADANPASISQ